MLRIRMFAISSCIEKDSIRRDRTGAAASSRACIQAMYVCICVCIYIYIYIRAYIYIYIYIYVYVYISLYIYIFIYLFIVIVIVIFICIFVFIYYAASSRGRIRDGVATIASDTLHHKSFRLRQPSDRLAFSPDRPASLQGALQERHCGSIISCNVRL